MRKERDFFEQSYSERAPEIKRPSIFRPQSESLSSYGPKREEAGIVNLLSEVSKKDQAQAERGQSFPKRNGVFEPFINDENNDQQGCRFINFYGGNFAQDMQLNRLVVERVIKIASLDGQIILATLSPNRQRSIDANPDGSVTAKRRLFWGEKVKREEENNPAFLVTSIPSGWRIEMNDQKLMEELTGDRGSEEVRGTFVKRFNLLLREAIFECMRREKLSGEKDERFKRKLLYTMFQPLVPILAAAFPFSEVDKTDVPLVLMSPFVMYALGNFLDKHVWPIPIRGRRIDHLFEFFMPYVEVDKVVRSFAYLNLAGRRLVGLRKTFP